MTIAYEISEDHRQRSVVNRRIEVRRQPAIGRFCGRELLEVAGSGGALPEILGTICRSAEEVLSRCRCAVYLVDWHGPALRAGAAPSLPAGFVEAICALPVRPDAAPCARAACSQSQVIAADLPSDPSWRDSSFGTLALEHGLKSCWSTPISTSDGRVLGTFAVLRSFPGRPTLLEQDLIARITLVARIAIERAQSGAALERCEASLAATQRLTRTGSFVWRTETQEMLWSEELYRIYGLDEREGVTPELAASRLHPADSTSLCETLDQARTDGGDIEHEHRLVMPDQSVRYLRMAACATCDEDGELAYVGAVQDVTRDRAAEAELDKARSDLARMARNISLAPLSASIVHEVSQPLSGVTINIGTGLRMLTADPPDVGGALDAMRRTLRDSRRASEIIVRLQALFTAKEPRAAPVDLNEAARDVLGFLLTRLRRNRVTIRTELQEDLPPAIGDRMQLQLVILNLLLNASEAMNGIDGRPRLLVIRTKREDEGRVRLEIRDSGAGLDPATIDRLFEPFYTSKRDGMGIGLFVSRFIVERHRGRLQAVPNEGPGATFAISLPSAQRPMPA